MSSKKSTKKIGPVEQVLTKALEKIKKGWCRGATAVNKTGMSVSVNSKHAVRFCSMGSVMASTRNKDLVNDARCLLSEMTPGPFGIIQYNDDMAKKPQILGVFKKAIKKAHEEGL